MILKKLGEEYKLYSHDSCIATTQESPYKKLSKENCDEIFGVFNVEKLAYDSSQEFLIKPIESPIFTFGYEEGFNKAMELNKDKLFTVEDMIEFAKWTFLEVGSNTGKNRTNEQLLLEWKSLQQTEWDVEIEMVKTPDGIFRENDVPYSSPKLDVDGCLILKKL
jgi:hypothetical protein